MSKPSLLISFLLVTGTLLAQTPTTVEVRLAPVGQHDLYCSGFLTTRAVPRENFVVAAYDSPDFVRYVTGDYVYLQGTLPEGSEYSIVRQLRNPDRQELFSGQHATLAATGQAYSAIGKVRIVGSNAKTSIGQVVFSCDPVLPGDFAVPYHEPAAVSARRMIAFNRFPLPGKSLRGRIVMARDFEGYAGTGGIVYLNLGSDQGLQPGDYFRAVRGYGKKLGDITDRATYEATVYDDTQAHPVITDASPLQRNGARIQLSTLPERAIGEMLVLNVSPRSATALVVFSLQDIEVGDYVERDALPAPSEAEMAGPNAPPKIACSAQPPAVRAGGTSLISCDATSADGHPVALGFMTDRGKIETGADNGAFLQTAGLPAGEVHVTATATDSHNLKTIAFAVVNVEASSLASMVEPPPPPAPAADAAPVKIAEVRFAPGSNLLSNEAKVQLDEATFRIEREEQAQVVIIGRGNPQTPAGQRLAQKRAENIRNYFVTDMQVESKRLETRSGASGDRAEIWLVPPGAVLK
ncbi:MAG: OmpA family protein [Acidobacteria bacterium]|nr:OmpA family protein [Acidobacteriota bacterium]